VLLENQDALEAYKIDLLKNGAIDFYLHFVGTTSSYEPYYYYVHGEGYVLSDGNDYIEFNGKCTLDMFYVFTANQEYNQLVIEFVSN